jgi:hypothetical protein
MRVAIGNVLDNFADLDPERILEKNKLHLLTHCPDDARQFGPMPRSSVETYECYNAVFRCCAVLSNQQAVSHDIATQFSHMSVVKQLLAGGYYMDTHSGHWKQAGEGVRKILYDEPVIGHHLGWVTSITKAHGMPNL